MNKIISKYLAILFIIGGIFSQTIMVSASCMTEVTVEAELDDITISERTVNTTETISLNAGNTWKKRFKTSKLIGTDHDAFSVKVTGVSGSYKVQIMGGNGYFYESSNYSNSGVTITVTNANPSVNYTVTLINTSAVNNLSATIEIKSYVAP